jgi:hypothetical protein
VLDPALNVPDGAPGIAFVPLAIEVLGRDSELDDQVSGKVLRPDLAPLFLPKADQGLFVLAHDDAGVGAADEVAPILNLPRCADCHFHLPFTFTRIRVTLGHLGHV